MSRRAVVVLLIGCCLLLGGGAIETAAPAVAASTATSRTAPGGLTKPFPLGPQRLCCQSQSKSHSQTAAAPPSGRSSAPSRAGAGRSSGAHSASSGLPVAAIWIIAGGVGAVLLALGIADFRRKSAPVPAPGVPAAGHAESARARVAADLVAPARRERSAAKSQREGAARERRRRGRPETVERLAYRRADMSTPARVEFNVAVILHERGDVAEAIAAYRRAERRGDPDAAFNLGVLLCEAGDLDGAETSWQRSAHYGNARATDDLGFLVRRSRERQTAGTEREGADR
jgi:tetratricopeptide repeat protein